MTEQIRYRINRDLVEQAERVCEDLGLSPTQAVSLFFAQLVKLGALPFRPSNFPALDEYGATLADADAAEDRALKEIQADRKAGKVVRFTGKLP
jgi:addiction module RelB/DinJ family antitoxin